MKKTKNKKETGTAIVLVISIMATLMVVVGVAFEYTTTIGRQVQRSNSLESAMAIADGCLDYTFAYWREACRQGNNTNKALTTNELIAAGIPLPTQAQFPNVPNFSATKNNYNSAVATMVQQCKVIAVDPQLNAMGASTKPTGGYGQNSNTVTYNYLASAFVTLPTLRGNVVAKVQRVLSKEQFSPWNYAIFYIDPLEIHPGPTFNVTGPVHTNSTLYTGHKSLNFKDKVTYTTDWVHDFKKGDPRAPGGSGREIPTEATYPSNLPPALDVAHQPFGLDSQSLFNTTDLNQNNDSYHELIEPPSAGVDVLAGQRYWNQAGVVIQISDLPVPNTVTYWRPDPTTGSLTTGTGVQLTAASAGGDKKLYDMFKTSNAITTNQLIQDNREVSQVRLATLDISKIYKADKSGWLADNFNGIVYLHDTTAAANGVGAKRGIRLKNGKFIPNGGLTVASGNPVYVQGDYNTGGVTPLSNSGDPTKPDGGPGREACSILADAVTILSNAWNDANDQNSTDPISVRTASNTTINTAIVSGNVPTPALPAEGYSGGAENFPRFLEDWSSSTMTYYGSMVELYQSKQAIGPWGKGTNVYSPPTRQWYFDNNFKTQTPPGTLMVYSYVKGRWSLAP